MNLFQPNIRRPARARAGKPVFLCACLLLCFATARGRAEEKPVRVPNPQSLFYQANNLYEHSRYEEASLLYHQLLDCGYESGNLYFNLGNTYFKMGRRGLAVLYFEKARRLIPRDADLHANLTYALEGVEEGTPDWKREFLWNLAVFFPAEQLAVFTSLCFFLVTAVVSMALLFPEKVSVSGNENRTSTDSSLPRRAPGRYRSWWLGCLCVFSFCLLSLLALGGLQYLERSTPAGVAVEKGGAVRYEPTEEATVHFSLSEGSRVTVTGEKDDWYLISRRDGRRGWVQKRYIGKI